MKTSHWATLHIVPFFITRYVNDVRLEVSRLWRGPLNIPHISLLASSTLFLRFFCAADANRLIPQATDIWGLGTAKGLRIQQSSYYEWSENPLPSQVLLAETQTPPNWPHPKFMIFKNVVELSPPRLILFLPPPTPSQAKKEWCICFACHESLEKITGSSSAPHHQYFKILPETPV